MHEKTFRAIKELYGCTFAPATPEKRFVNQMIAKHLTDELTEPQLMYLGQIHYRYRKQIEARKPKEKPDYRDESPELTIKERNR